MEPASDPARQNIHILNQPSFQTEQELNEENLRFRRQLRNAQSQISRFAQLEFKEEKQ